MLFGVLFLTVVGEIQIRIRLSVQFNSIDSFPFSERFNLKIFGRMRSLRFN
jgi:hypothetical protein